MKVLGYSAKREFIRMLTDLTSFKTIKRQLPNLLTISRVFGPLFIVPLAISNNILAATIVVTIVAITDLLDGFVARKLNATSQFGKDLDPVCDKLFVLGITIPLIFYDLYYLSIILFEGMISIVNFKSRAKGIVDSSYIGKIKTFALFSLLCISYLKINYLIPKTIIPSLFTLTIFLQLAALYGYIDRYKEKINT